MACTFDLLEALTSEISSYTLVLLSLVSSLHGCPAEITATLPSRSPNSAILPSHLTHIIVSHRPSVSVHFHRRSTTNHTSSHHHQGNMCWITLTPKRTPGHHHHTHSAHGSSVEELVKIHHSAHNPRYSKVRIATPNVSIASEHHGHHHHHHHLPHVHPLHMHPIDLLPHHHHHHHHRAYHLHGPGKKRSPPPPAPPPSSCHSSREPIYRTQIVEPKTCEVRETTRIALREVRPERRQRGRLRRVAGYEVLGKEVPWDWDCVSNTPSSSSSRRGSSGLRFPPFGSIDQWM